MRRHLSLLACAAILGVAIAFPLGVVASHQFTDVPNTNTFHDDIDAIADAGVTTGCAAGKYCPKDFVTREQMAAFLNRLGALAPGKTPVVNATKVDGLDSTQFSRIDVANPGQVTCAGSSMLPLDSVYTYGTSFNSLFSTTGSEAHFRCQLHLPDGATIVLFAAAVSDQSDTEQAQCALRRHARLGITSGTVASAPASTLAFDGGNVILAAPSITDPVVDNGAYVYTALCSIEGSGNDISLIATTVQYTVTGPALE